MFYAECRNPITQRPVVAEIRRDNVFSHCLECGEEVPIINFAELIAKKDFDLYTTGIYCPNCAERLQKERSDEHLLHSIFKKRRHEK